MSRGSANHGSGHAELVVLYAMRALPPSEVPVAEAQTAACEDCRRELEMLRPVIDSFAFWPTEVVRPSPSLWDRLARRIATETGDEPVSSAPPRSVEPEWQEVGPGIWCKLLATDPDRDRVSMMVRLTPGTDYPPHRHAGVEELFMLHGELIVDGTTFYPGQYRRAEAGTVDRRVWSETGCTCVLVTSFDDAIL